MNIEKGFHSLAKIKGNQTRQKVSCPGIKPKPAGQHAVLPLSYPNTLENCTKTHHK